MSKLEYKISLDEITQGLISKGDIEPIIDEIRNKAVEKFLQNAMHAPSSPVTPRKAEDLFVWYQKAKKAGMEF